MNFEGVFELFDVSVRRLQNGNKLKVVLEMSEDLDVERKLIEFRGQNVKLEMTQNVKPEEKEDTIFVSSIFEVFDIKCRRLRNGDKLSVVLEQQYEKKTERAMVDLRFEDIKLFMTKVQEELDPREAVEGEE